MINTVFKILFFILIPLFLTCKKDIGPLQNQVSSTDSASDSIVYINFSPDIEITSASGYSNHPSGCGIIVSPLDSTEYFILDLDGDSINDLKIQVRQFFISTCVSGSNPCSGRGFEATVVSLHNNIFVANKLTAMGKPHMFDYGDTLNNLKKWQNGVSVWVGNCYASLFFSGDKYVGIKVQKNGKSYFGWLMFAKDNVYWKFYLKELAINYSDSRPIMAGQTN